MLSIILAKGLTIIVIIFLNALYHGWVDSKYDDNISRMDHKGPVVILSIVFGIVCIVTDTFIGLTVITSLIGFIAAVFGVFKIATLLRNYSYRKFTEKN